MTVAAPYLSVFDAELTEDGSVDPLSLRALAEHRCRGSTSAGSAGTPAGRAWEPLSMNFRFPSRRSRTTRTSMTRRKTSDGERLREVEGLNPGVLKWARERAGHSVPEVARK